ncbi:hypothetical protein Taro_047647 [Colocasia esculenta]|uniref:Uncharacterized protein n=1 Tax=Colocasia esculenta TaxID=4460 RepID=A0A843X5N4_COLES|nr:hypothetical protein [Colocasia esculenta]
MAASLCFLLLLPSLTIAQSSSGGPCQTLDDCDGQLIRIAGKGDDDPDAGSHICSGGGGGDDGGGSGSDCQQSGTLTCGSNTYTFCPPVITSTAILTNNDLSQGGGGGGAPSDCDEEYWIFLSRLFPVIVGGETPQVRLLSYSMKPQTPSEESFCRPNHGLRGQG